MNKQIEMEDAVKKEDSSDDENDTLMNISNDELKKEIKSKNVIFMSLIFMINHILQDLGCE